MKTLKTTSIALFACLSLSGLQQVYAQVNMLDQSFGTAGMVQTEINTGYDNAFCTAIQPDGKILAAGTSMSGATSAIAVARYNSDGTPDLSFGTNGITITSILSRGWANSIAVQSDGKILVAGAAGIGSETDLVLVRYLSTGVPDASFGTNGIVRVDESVNEEAYALSILSDGKVLVSGTTYSGSDFDFLLLKYNSNGTPDAAFGTGGRVVTSLDGNYEFGRAMLVQNNGKIVVAGATFHTISEPVLLRFNSNGSPDTSFGNNGAAIIETASSGNLYSIAMQEGKIIAAGNLYDSGSDNDFAVFCFLDNGTPDPAFGTGGRTVIDYAGVSNIFTSVLIQNDRKIIACGTFYDYSNRPGSYITRFNAEGDVDLTFNATGSVITTISGITYEVLGAALQPDEKIVTVGAATSGGNSRLVTARYLNEGYLSTPSSGNLANVQVYPNPAETEIVIGNVGAGNYGTAFTLTDQSGRILIHGTLSSGSTTVDVSTLSPGMYHLRAGAETIPVVKR